MAGKGAPKKDFVQCAHCGNQQAKDILNLDGFNLSENIGKSLMCRISCPCGVSTKLCETKSDLQEVWNSRPKKPFIKPVLKVTHSGPRGAEPGTEASKQGPF